MKRHVIFGGLGIGFIAVVLLAAALMTSNFCSQWNPLSCRGPDPELVRYSR
jgi:hypothetical protein